MYSSLSGITHNNLMNMPLFCRVTRGDIMESTCMYLFHMSINIDIHVMNIPGYFKAEIILEEEGYLGHETILDIVGIEEDCSITLNNITISGGWYRRTYNIYMRVYGLNEVRHIKKFYIDSTSTLIFPSKFYLLSLSNSISNSDINIWKNALCNHLLRHDDIHILNHSAIHTLMIMHILNFKSSSGIEDILISIMSILGKRVTKEVLYIITKRIVDYKYHSERLIYDIILELEDYVNSTNYNHEIFMQLLDNVKNIRV